MRGYSKLADIIEDAWYASIKFQIGVRTYREHELTREECEMIVTALRKMAPSLRPENTPEVIEQARKLVMEKPSTSYIQRKLKIGYNQAAELMELFECEGLVSEPNTSGVRTVSLTSAKETGAAE